MSEQQPDVQWAFPPEKPRAGRVWLIIGLVAGVLLIAGAFAFSLIPRDAPSETTTPSPTSSPSSTATATPTRTPTPTSAPETIEPSAPATVAPEPPDPDIEAFRGQVAPRLDDALTGLEIVEGLAGQDAVSVLESLQQDAQRLSDSPVPSAIDSAWRDALSSYSQAISDLRAEVDGGASADTGRASEALDRLRSVAGL